MSHTIKGSKFLGTTSSDAFLDYYNQQKFCDVILVIKGDEMDNLDMSETFFEESSQNFQISNGNGLLQETWSDVPRRMPSHYLPENLPQDFGTGLRYLLGRESENVPDFRPGPSTQNWMQDTAPADIQNGTRHPLRTPETESVQVEIILQSPEAAIPNRNEGLPRLDVQGSPRFSNQSSVTRADFHFPSERVADPGNRISTHGTAGDGGLSTVTEGTLERDHEFDGQRESEHGGSIYSVASRGGTELVSADDLSSYRDNNQNIVEPDVPIPEGSSLNFSTNHTSDPGQNMRSLGSSTRSLSTLRGSIECDYKLQKLCHKNILAKNSCLLEEFLDSATNHLEVINPTHQSLETAHFIAAMTQVEGRKIMQVEVKDVDASSMESILTFIYTGELKFQFEDFATLMQDAEKLQFCQVLDLCQDFLSKPLDASNCIPVLLSNYYSGNEEASDFCLHFLMANISDVRKEQNQEVIRSLPLDIMENVMNSNAIVESNAEDAFEMFIIWADGGQGSKAATVHALMKPKIDLLYFDFLLANLADPEIIQLDPASLKMVHSTIMAKKPVSTFSPPEKSSVSPVSLSSNEAQSSQGEQTSPLTSPKDTDETKEETLLVLTVRWASGYLTSEVPEIFDTKSNTWIEWTTECLGNVFNAIVVGKFMVTFGEIKDGSYCQNVKLYNTETQKPISGPNMINARVFFGYCVVNGDTVIVCGGLTAQDKELAVCELLKLKSNGTGRWERLPPMTTERHCCSAASIGNRVFIIGGQIGIDLEAKVYSTVEEFDVTSKKWRTRSNMNEARSDFAIATHQNMIYVFGGWRAMMTLNSCEQYDPCIDKWQYICCLPSPRQDCAVGLLKSQIFLIGGCSSDLQRLKATAVYDPKKDQFWRGPDLNNENLVCCVTVKKGLVFN